MRGVKRRRSDSTRYSGSTANRSSRSGLAICTRVACACLAGVGEVEAVVEAVVVVQVVVQGVVEAIVTTTTTTPKATRSFF